MTEAPLDVECGAVGRREARQQDPARSSGLGAQEAAAAERESGRCWS